MIPSVEPKEVGATGLLWLLISYGYILYYASNLISEGSDLLLLVPSLAGLVGGVVLPLLGAVPDGAIILFSGLGSLKEAQETLSVGVGALAGSTIMLLTVPLALSVFAGRVDLRGPKGQPAYNAKTKLNEDTTLKNKLMHTGVAVTKEVKHGAVITVMTTIPYFLIQVPAFFLHGPSDEVAAGEKFWALGGLILCLVGFVSYLSLQLKASKRGEDKLKRVEVMKDLLQKGKVSLTGAMNDVVKTYGSKVDSDRQVDYGSVPDNEEELYPPPDVKVYLDSVLKESFQKYDKDHNHTLEKTEVKMFLRDFHENISDDDIDLLFNKYDTDDDGTVEFDEFVGACYSLIRTAQQAQSGNPVVKDHQKIALTLVEESGFGNEEEQEDVPEDISSLSPDEQQKAIKKRAFIMLFSGTFLVLLFSDPMVGVMSEVAARVHISSFYVSFILAPLASNASEVIASQYYAAKKTRKTITVSLTALEGAASMNNTFCLSIFMALVFFRGLAWEFTAETVAIIVVQFVIAFMMRADTLTVSGGCIILAIFPLSILLVAGLEAIGFD